MMPDDATTSGPPNAFTEDSRSATTGPPLKESSQGNSLPSQGGAPISVSARRPEFATLEEGNARNSPAGMDRFYDVHVPVWAELGRVELPLGDLLKIAEGSVLRLDRPVSDPVDLVSQGVKLARGEVIVIDDCFAIRIKEIIGT